MNLDIPTPPNTTPKQSETSFDDLPVVALLGLNPAEMSQEQRVAFVTHLRTLRQGNTLRAKVSKEVKESKPKVENVGPSVHTLWDDLLKD
jgi:hypothetical protein